MNSAMTRKFIYFLLLIFIAVAATAAKPKLTSAYVELMVRDKVASPFYNILIGPNQKPYVRVDSVLSILNIPQRCFIKRAYCVASIMPGRKRYWINGNTLSYGNFKNKDLKTRGRFNKSELLVRNGKVWVSYTLLGKWLPLKVMWDLDDYEITVEPQYESLADFRKAHRLTLARALSENKKEKLLKGQKIIKPTKGFNTQLLYLINGAINTQGNGAGTFELNSSTDIFKGNFDVIYDANYDHNFSSQTPDWNYTRLTKNEVHQFQLGKVFVDNNQSLLLPTLTLKNAASYTRTSTVKAAGDFVYHGFAMSGTEINVWRNGVLRKIMRIKQSGTYTISDTSAQDGDVYTLKFFYQNGATGQKQIIVSNSLSGLMPRHKFDATGTTGNLDKYGQYTNVDFSYGLFERLTVELQGYRFPISAYNGNAVGAALTYKPATWLSFDYQDLMYKHNDDQAVRADISAFKRQSISLIYRAMAANSPVRQIGENPAALQFLPLPFEIPSKDSSTRWWIANDAFAIGNYNFTINADATDVYKNTTFEEEKEVASWLDLTLLQGVYKPQSKSYAPWAGYSVVLTPMDSMNVSLSQNYVAHHPDLSNTSMQFSYYTMKANKQDLSLTAGFEKAPNSRWEWYATVRKQIIPEINVGISASNDEVLASVNIGQVLSFGPHSDDPDAFALGALEGHVMGPSAEPGKEKPLSHVKISAAGRTAITDKNGKFQLYGLPTDQPTQVVIDTDSLPATLLPAQSTEVVEFRPSTYITFNPKIQSSVGIYGEVVMNKHHLVPGEKFEVIDIKKHKIDKVVRFEYPTGFFMVSGLLPGDYELKPVIAKQGPHPLYVHIKPNGQWVNDVKWVWDK